MMMSYSSGIKFFSFPSTLSFFYTFAPTFESFIKTTDMGKGDKKSKRGKIVIGSYGVRRAKKKKKIIPAAPKPVEPKPKKVVAEKVAVEKVAAEKAVVEIVTAEKVIAAVEPIVENEIPGVAKEKAVRKTAKKATKKEVEGAEVAEAKPKATKTKKKVTAEETPALPEEPKQ